MASYSHTNCKFHRQQKASLLQQPSRARTPRITGWISWDKRLILRQTIIHLNLVAIDNPTDCSNWSTIRTGSMGVRGEESVRPRDAAMRAICSCSTAASSTHQGLLFRHKRGLLEWHKYFWILILSFKFFFFPAETRWNKAPRVHVE